MIEKFKKKENHSPARGGPNIAAAPRNMQMLPNAFVNLSRPTSSTMMIDVRLMYAAMRVQSSYINILKGKVNGLTYE